MIWKLVKKTVNRQSIKKTCNNLFQSKLVVVKIESVVHDVLQKAQVQFADSL